MSDLSSAQDDEYAGADAYYSGSTSYATQDEPEESDPPPCWVRECGIAVLEHNLSSSGPELIPLSN